MNQKQRFIRCLSVLAALSFMMIPVHGENSTVDRSAPAIYESQFPVKQITAQTAAPLLEGSAPYPVLEGKSILFVGDSLTAGYGLSDVAKSWPRLLESRYGMDVTVCSVSGSTMAASDKVGYEVGGCYKPYVGRPLPEGNFDIVFVEGGGNDWYCAVPLGDDPESRDPKTFMGAVNVVIDRIQKQYPNAALVFMTSWLPPERNSEDRTPEEDYYEAMSEICAMRDIPCFQAGDPNVSGVNVRANAFRLWYCIAEDDYWHLNAAGQARFAPVIAGWLEEQARERVLVAGFLDVKRQQWFADTVQYAVDEGLMNGLEPELFGPDEPMQRGMLVTVLYRAAGEPSVEGLAQPFVDVAEGAYYENAVRWSYHQGMVTGKDERHFDPEGCITREQMAAILYRQQVEVQAFESEALPENLQKFTDGELTAGYALEPLSWAVERGIIKGMDDGRVDPQGEAKRAQVAAMLQRYFTQAEPDPDPE